jgi:microcystin-dependent protein
MAGTLFGLGLSQQHDANGVPMPGCLLFLYEANTSTPVVAYQTPGLVVGQELPWPVEADSAGRIPAFWLDDGAYRARLTDANGVVQFDEGNILALGVGGGTITTPSTPDAAILTTGDVLWRPVNTTKTGWVRLNGRTMGSATSGASERANADTQSLFEYLWANFSDTLCPVSAGRGGSAAADFGANKTITLLDMRGRSAFGTDDMGNSVFGWFSSYSFFAAGNGTTGGAKGGGSVVQLATANLPAHSHTITDPGHAHTLSPTASWFRQTGGVNVPQTSPSLNVNIDTLSVVSNTTGITGTNNAGSDTPHDNMSPFMLGTWYMRL